MEKHRPGILAHLLQGVSVIAPLLQPYFGKKVSLTCILFLFFFWSGGGGALGWQRKTWVVSYLSDSSVLVAKFTRVPQDNTTPAAHVVFCSLSPIGVRLHTCTRSLLQRDVWQYDGETGNVTPCLENWTYMMGGKASNQAWPLHPKEPAARVSSLTTRRRERAQRS